MLSNAFYIDANGNTYLYNSKGQMYKGGYTKFDVSETDKDGKESKVVKFRYFTNEGVMAKGVTVIDGSHNILEKTVSKLKIRLVTFKGKTYYFVRDTLVMVSRILGEISMVSGTTLMQTVLLLQVHKSSMVKNFTSMKMEAKLKVALLRMQMVLTASTKKVLES